MWNFAERFNRKSINTFISHGDGSDSCCRSEVLAELGREIETEKAELRTRGQSVADAHKRALDAAAPDFTTGTGHVNPEANPATLESRLNAVRTKEANE